MIVTPQQGILWALTIGGSILFVIVSKVTILMKPLVNKAWYTELVLYLICLAMGTMLAAISFQLIPEGIGRLTTLIRTKVLYGQCKHAIFSV